MFGKGRYPNNWKEMSVDARLMSAYFVGMVALSIASEMLRVRLELVITAATVTVLGLISRHHRHVSHWKWPGVQTQLKPGPSVYKIMARRFT